MLSAFASVGVETFNLTLTNIEGEKVAGGYRPNRPLEELRRTVSRAAASVDRESQPLKSTPAPRQ
jgi:hypothetical protein